AAEGHYAACLPPSIQVAPPLRRYVTVRAAGLASICSPGTRLGRYKCWPHPRCCSSYESWRPETAHHTSAPGRNSADRQVLQFTRAHARSWQSVSAGHHWQAKAPLLRGSSCSRDGASLAATTRETLASICRQ